MSYAHAAPAGSPQVGSQFVVFCMLFFKKHAEHNNNKKGRCCSRFTQHCFVFVVWFCVSQGGDGEAGVGMDVSTASEGGPPRAHTKAKTLR